MQLAASMNHLWYFKSLNVSDTLNPVVFYIKHELYMQIIIVMYGFKLSNHSQV